MYEKIWESPDKLIKKEILEAGVFGSKPTDNSTCTIEITNVNVKANSILSEYIRDDVTYPLDLIIGESNTALDRHIEKCVAMMHQDELSTVVVALPQNGEHDENHISFNIKLCHFVHGGYIYEWSAGEKCTIAQKHKDKGVELFKGNRFKDASHRFSRALKLVLSIPIPVDEIPKDVDGVELQELYKLHANLYNNLASCYSKEKQYDAVLELCTKVLEIQKDDVKALYKRGCAYIEMKNYEKAHKDLTELLTLECENKAAKEKLKLVNLSLCQEEAKFNTMVKKMFRT